MTDYSNAINIAMSAEGLFIVDPYVDSDTVFRLALLALQSRPYSP